MNKTILSLLALGTFAYAASAEPIQFDFKDPKGVNNAVFKLDAPLESINGTARGVSGTTAFDPAAPGDFKGKIVIAAASLHVDNPVMKEHLHGDKWMDVARYPEISFEVEKVEKVKTLKNVTTAEVTGKMTVRGQSRTLTVPVSLTYLKGMLRARGGNQDGDLLVVRTSFNIKRSDYGINAGQFEEKVSDEIVLSLSVAGAAPRS